MREEESLALVALLSGAYPRWTMDKMSLQVMAATLTDYDFDDGRTAVKHWIDTENYPPVPAQMRSTIEAEISRRNWDEKLPALLEAKLACDGTGYIERDNGMEPCPRCNPFLRDRWKHGRWNEEIRKEDIPEGFTRPPACRNYDPTNVPTFEEGMAIARKAYVADKTAEGWDLDRIEKHWPTGGKPPGIARRAGR